MKKLQKVWGYVAGGNLYERAYFLDTLGLRDQEPWFTTEKGQEWSGYDVRFTPDNVEEFAAAYKKVKARQVLEETK